MIADLTTLSPDSLAWIFGADRPLASHEADVLLEQVDGFLETWNAHGEPLLAGRELHEGRFLVVGADPGVASPSGCSIDALVSVLRDFQKQQAVNLLGHGAVWFKGDEGVERASRPEFRALANEGKVGRETIVYDTSVTRLGDVLAGRWVGPAKDYWHGNVFFPSA